MTVEVLSVFPAVPAPGGPGPDPGANGGPLATDAELAAALATLPTTYVPLRGSARRRRDFSPWATVSPAVMAVPPTFATTGPGGASPISGSGADPGIPWNTPLVTHLGLVPVTFNQFSKEYWQNSVNTQGGSGTMAYAIEFDYYGADLAIWFRNNAANLSRFWVWVDGAPATAAPATSSAAAAGSRHTYRITFAGSAWRRIRVYMSQADFGGIDTAASTTVLPTPKPSLSIGFLGDSYTAGANATDPMQAFPYTVGRLLDAEVYNAGIAGTGYVSAGGTAVFGDSTRLAKLVTAAPDWIVVTGSINDQSATPTAVSAAATALYASLATSLPNTRLIVVGVQPNPAMAATGNNVANNAALKVAAQAASNVQAFLDPYLEGWITGTGKVGTTTGDGNSDVMISSDGIHPSQAGHDLYARRIANRVLAALGG